MRSNRKLASSLVLAVVILCAVVGAHAQLVSSVDAVGMTVSNMDRAVDFYSRVLTLNEQANDLLHRYTALRAADVAGADRALVHAHSRFISPECRMPKEIAAG